MNRNKYYPFSAIVGQESMKKALLLNIINPRIGGILICGEKGTAKSTIVRSISSLCQQPYCEIPLSISEDRLIGSIDLEKTIELGEICFLNGILGTANNGFIYIDEVNLLPDHIVDVLLNVSANKTNHVEREGLSVQQECNFLLFGTMNSEEGFLRPQFLDRFGLFVNITSEKNPLNRVEIIKRRQAYDKDPKMFIERYAQMDKELVLFLDNAKKVLHSVCVTQKNIQDIVQICLEANIEGHRGDLIMLETAKAIAAYNLRTYITKEDLEEAAHFSLLHRRKDSNEPPAEEKQEQQQDHNEDNKPDEQNDMQDENETPMQSKHHTDSQQDDLDSSSSSSENEHDNGNPQKPQKGNAQEQVFNIGQNFKVRKFGFHNDRKPRTGQGKRTQIRSGSKSGQYIYSTSQRKYDDLALDATIRAAAPYQIIRKKEHVAIAIDSSDIREKVRQKKVSNLLVFLVDGSGSMGVNQRMSETKGAVLSLLKDAYIKRDRVAMIVFHGNSADVVLPPTRSVQRGYKMLENMSTGGKTPLNTGISKAVQVIKSEQRKNKNILPMMIIITDGKGNVPLHEGQNPRKELLQIAEEISLDKTIESMVIDIEKTNLLSFGLAKDIALKLNASYYKLDELKSSSLLDIINNERN